MYSLLGTVKELGGIYNIFTFPFFYKSLFFMYHQHIRNPCSNKMVLINVSLIVQRAPLWIYFLVLSCLFLLDLILHWHPVFRVILEYPFVRSRVTCLFMWQLLCVKCYINDIWLFCWNCKISIGSIDMCVCLICMCHE